MLKVEFGVDACLMPIPSVHSAPLAAHSANAWANILLAIVDEMYSSPGGSVDFYNAQLAQTKAPDSRRASAS